jgi:hypothetical protein
VELTILAADIPDKIILKEELLQLPRKVMLVV